MEEEVGTRQHWGKQKRLWGFKRDIVDISEKQKQSIFDLEPQDKLK